MTNCQAERRRRQGLAAFAALFVIGACAEPARVVLYDERNPNSRRVASPPRGAVSEAGKVQPRSANRRDHRSVSTARPATAHQVHSGDTVYTIALRYQVPIRGLIKLNGLKAPYVLRSGQFLRLPKPRRHTVQPGDTIYRISQIYDVALSRLVQLNEIEAPYKIVVGRRLRLPDSVEPSKEVAVATLPRNSAILKPPPKRQKRKEREPTARIRPPISKSTPSPRVAAVIPKPPPLSSRKFLLPVRGRLLSKFGSKGRGLRNDGVNIAAPRGTPVRAAENGIVVYSGNALLGFGNMILLRHANGYMTAYAHNASVSVARGDTVRRGQVIAKVGSSGNVASPQLHFEIRKGKRAINPATYLPNLATATR